MTQNLLTPQEREFLKDCLSAVIDQVAMVSVEDSENPEYTLPTPKDIYNHLCKYVVGQDEAKKTLAVAAHNHYKRLMINKNADDYKPIDKANVLVIGPTGSGKTHMIKILADFMGVPYYIADANSLTAAGYVGKDVEDLISGLLENAEGQLAAAGAGIIFIDEFDKISKRSSGTHSRDIGGEAVQQALLKLVEGTSITVTKSSGVSKTQITVDTNGILFIVSGAFVGLEEVIKARTKKDGTKIGFGATVEKEKAADISLIHKVTPQDIEKYGFIPELIGRLPLIATLDDLSDEDLVKVLNGVENSVMQQYSELFSYYNNNLTVDSDAFLAIAKNAKKTKNGARGLKAIMEKLLRDDMFELKDAHVTAEKVRATFGE